MSFTLDRQTKGVFWKNKVEKTSKYSYISLNQGRVFDTYIFLAI